MANGWKPVEAKERYSVLDLGRGLALFGVLLVNLLYFFRVSLFAHMLDEHSHPGWLNYAVDNFVSRFVEFKAFDLFSLTFGVGVAVQEERARARGVLPAFFLARRFLVLLAFGVAHMTLVSNVDILSLYAVCGLATIAALRLPAVALAVLGAAAVVLPSLIPVPPIPGALELRSHAADATRIYGHASFGIMLDFRWQETTRLILPLLVSVAQKTFGLMLVGIAIWRSGVIRSPGRRRSLLWTIAVVGTAGGLLAGLHVPLAIGYGAALLAANPRGRWTAPFVAAGRMAFTNYLVQSLVFATVFYGFRLFGRLAPAPVALAGVLFYAAQLWLSVWWLRRHRFGPFEWIWRSLTYGRRM